MAYVLGIVAILIFGLTLPATRITVGFLDPFFVSFGRAVVAAGIALVVLLIRRSEIFPWRLVPRLFIVALGVIIGFPLFSALAMQGTSASHGAVVLGVLPLATAIAGSGLAGERPGLKFWLLSIVGAIIVTAYVVMRTGRTLTPHDGFLLLAVISAAIGYAEGGRLSRIHSGWQIISWALIVALPLTLPVTLLHLPAQVIPGRAWLGFGYVSVFSMFLGFFAWYAALATGGIARVGQLQLLQPFFTISFGALLLGEEIRGLDIGTAVLVATCIYFSRDK
jgi:drug/metabolite transporter (DMT)-like permease